MWTQLVGWCMQSPAAGCWCATDTAVATAATALMCTCLCCGEMIWVAAAAGAAVLVVPV
jgi:hypothetical protein